MDKMILEADERQLVGKAVRRLRQAGKLPVVVYGHGLATQPLVVDARAAQKIYHQAGTSRLIDLKIGTDSPRSALIQDVQFDVQTGDLVHADLYIVRMNEELQTEVPLHFVGETSLVYQQEGTLVKGIEAVEIKCLPGDLPEAIEVDISGLDEFEKAITLADVVLPNGVALVAEEPEAILVAKVEAPRSDEELAELDAEVVEELPEGAAEDGEATEGETTPEPAAEEETTE